MDNAVFDERGIPSLLVLADDNLTPVALRGDSTTGLYVTLKSPLESNGAVPINIQDQHTDIVDLHLTQEVDTFTLAGTVTLDTNTLNVEAGHSIVVGEMLCFQEGTRFMQAEVLVVVTNAITIDTPFDFAYTVAAVCSNNLFNLNVNGSVTMQRFSVSPKNLQAGERWDITRIMILIEDDVVMDTAKFGGIAALTKGIVLRVKNGNNKNVFNAKTNGDLASHSFDVVYDDRAPAGTFAIRVRSSFAGQAKRGVSIRLNKDDDDEFQVLIQDDLTALATFHAIVQGHVVTD